MKRVASLTPEQFTLLQAVAKVWKQKAEMEAETLAEIKRERKGEKAAEKAVGRAKQAVPGA